MLAKWFASLSVPIAVGFLSGTARAQSVEEFYRGKTITLIVGSDVGGGYDLAARVLAHHYGKHIPGNPSIVVQNKPGASSILAANYVYEIAPRDGTVIGGVQRPIPFQTVFGDTGVRFDPRKMQWLGSPTYELGVVVAWHTAPQKTAQDLFTMDMVVGGTGPATDPELIAHALNTLIGTRFKTVSGYRGQAQVVLAMQRGEVQGSANWSWSEIEAGHPDWLRDHTVRILMQLGLRKGTSPYLKDVPLVMEFARTDEQRKVLSIIMGMKALGRPYFVAPGVPADRTQTLRTAFMETMKDPEFRAEAERTIGPVDPLSGEEVQKAVAEVYESPPDVIAKAREVVRVPSSK